MKKATRKTEIPAEPEVIAKILSNLADLFNFYPFVSSVSWERDALVVEVKYKKLIGGLTDRYRFKYKYSPSEDTLTIYGEGSRSRLALVIHLRPGFPNTLVKIDAFLDGAGGPIASGFLGELLKYTSQYLWLKAQDYLAGRLKLEEIPVKPEAVKTVEKIGKPFEEAKARPPSQVVPEKPVEKPAREEVVEKPMPSPSPPATVEEKPGATVEAVGERVEEHAPAGIETIPVDASCIREVSLLLDDVVHMAMVMLKAKLLARVKSSHPHSIADIIKEISGRSDVVECKELILSLRDSDIDGKITIDLEKMAITGALLVVGNEKYYEVDALSTLAGITRDLDVKIWCLKEKVVTS